MQNLLGPGVRGRCRGAGGGIQGLGNTISASDGLLLSGEKEKLRISKRRKTLRFCKSVLRGRYKEQVCRYLEERRVPQGLSEGGVFQEKQGFE